jgi:hypothetical protein
VRRDLLWIAADFSGIVQNALALELDRPTNGTRWTNRLLLFHMVLGHNIALSAIPLLGLFSRLPPAASRNWSRLLEACTGPYNWINWAGSAAAGQVLTPQGMLRMMDRTTRTIVNWYDLCERGSARTRHDNARFLGSLLHSLDEPTGHPHVGTQPLPPPPEAADPHNTPVLSAALRGL